MASVSNNNKNFDINELFDFFEENYENPFNGCNVYDNNGKTIYSASSCEKRLMLNLGHSSLDKCNKLGAEYIGSRIINYKEKNYLGKFYSNGELVILGGHGSLNDPKYICVKDNEKIDQDKVIEILLENKINNFAINRLFLIPCYSGKSGWGKLFFQKLINKDVFSKSKKLIIIAPNFSSINSQNGQISGIKSDEWQRASDIYLFSREMFQEIKKESNDTQALSTFKQTTKQIIEATKNLVNHLERCFDQSVESVFGFENDDPMYKILKKVLASSKAAYEALNKYNNCSFSTVDANLIKRFSNNLGQIKTELMQFGIVKYEDIHNKDWKKAFTSFST